MSEVALVTGGGRGIGRAIAIRLAEEGYAVGITARSVDQLEETAALVRQAGGRVAVAHGDVTDFGDVTKACRAISDELGPVDVLVNNAGYASQPAPFAEIDPDDWWRVIETNVRGPVNFSRAVLPDMVRRKHGYIVNINSLQGSKVFGASIAYGASKAALMRFTDALASEVAGSNVVVVDLSPGLVRTTMTENRPDLDALPPQAWSPPDAAAERLVALVSGRYNELSGRFVHLTDDLDDLVVRLAEDARILRMRPPAERAEG